MPETTLDPQTIDAKGKPPENRFGSFAGLHSAYQMARQEYGKNDIRFTSIRGIYDRLPPENPDYLREQGMEDMPNFNLGEFPAKVDSYVSTWIDHNTGGYKFASVKLKRKDDIPSEVANAYDSKATDFFNEAIAEWDDDEDVRSAAPYILESCVRDTQMGLFGIGIPYFKDDTDWRFCSIPTRKVFVPRGTKINLSNCPALFIESETTVTDIYNRVKASGEKSDWDKKAIDQMLYERTAENRAGTTSKESFAEWQNRVRDNDEFLGSNFSPVELVDCYVQEFNTGRKKDGITHYVIARSGTPQTILYKKDRRYKSYRQFIIPFSDNAGPEGDWHGVKGFGDSIYDNCHFQNQFFNDMARSAIISNMAMFMANSEADREKLSQIRMTKYGILNPGLTLNQVKISSDLSGMMAVFQTSQRTTNTSSRTYPTGESMGQEAKTATQSTFDRQDQAKLSSLQIKFYRMVGLDTLLAQMYKRLVSSPYPESLPGGRAAKSFRDKCEAAGIPKECYSKPVEVQADRTGGTGNMALDIMKAEKLMAVASPGRGQFNARMEIAKSVLQSGDRVIEFVQPEELPQEQQGIVDIENSNLTDGQIMPAREFQEHFIHLGEVDPNGQGHFGVLLTAYQAASQLSKQGVEGAVEDAQKLHRVLEATLSHIGMHVQFIGKMGIEQYQEAAKQMMKPLNDVAQFLQTFAQQIGSAMEQQQGAQPQMSAKDQAILINAQVKAQVEAQLAQQRMQHKEQDHVQKLGNMAERSAVKRELGIAEQEQKLNQQNTQFNVDIGQQASEVFMSQQIKEAELAKTRAQANVESVE